MKRDMDVIREILLVAEEKTPEEKVPGIAGIDQLVFAYHVQLLLDDDFLVATVAEDNWAPVDAVVIRLTNKGHDYAKAMTDNKVWETVKSKVIDSTSSWTMRLVFEFLERTAREAVTL